MHMSIYMYIYVFYILLISCARAVLGYDGGGRVSIYALETAKIHHVCMYR